MSKNKAIQKLISVAEAEVGYLEKRSNSNLDSKTANAGSNNYTKYWRDIYPAGQAQAWCAIFVNWCFERAFGKDSAKKLLKHYPYTYCPTMANLFKLHSNPQAGDIVIFKRGGSFVHTGLVVSVNGDYFQTIEGNTSGGSSIIANGGGVCRKGYYNSSLPGTKFCRPDYDIIGDVVGEDTNNSESKTEVKTVNIKMSVLKKGNKGEEVKTLQRLLVSLGHSCGSAGIDGDFGVSTDKAVREYQKKKSLGSDGIVGEKTWNSLLRGV